MWIDRLFWEQEAAGSNPAVPIALLVGRVECMRNGKKISSAVAE